MTRRPAHHFTPRANWMNDPNGLFHLDGMWHLFFQYNPEGPDWGNMSWGHATSTDLSTWTEHDVALPYGPGYGVFSGSAVVDHENTSGFGDGDVPPVVALYTRAEDAGRQSQWLAVSRDGGGTWAFQGDGPVIDRGSTDFRDPKVFRVDDSDGLGPWGLVAVEALDRQVVLYRSANLRDWEHTGTFGPVGPDGIIWECPDLFPLPFGGGKKWVLLLSLNDRDDSPAPGGSHMVYVVGEYDGRTFAPDDPDRWDLVDLGPDFYAGQTFDNAPGGRRIMVAWVGNWLYQHGLPHSGWRGAMTMARELGLRDVGGAARLVQTPVSEPGAPASPIPLVVEAEGAGELAAVRTEGEGIRVTRADPEENHPGFARDDLIEGADGADVYLDGDILELYAMDGAITYTAQLAPVEED